MDKQQQLEMWFSLGNHMLGIPKEYRNWYHHQFLLYIEYRIAELVGSLELNPADWELKEPSALKSQS